MSIYAPVILKLEVRAGRWISPIIFILLLVVVETSQYLGRGTVLFAINYTSRGSQLKVNNNPPWNCWCQQAICHWWNKSNITTIDKTNNKGRWVVQVLSSYIHTFFVALFIRTKFRWLLILFTYANGNQKFPTIHNLHTWCSIY